MNKTHCNEKFPLKNSATWENIYQRLFDGIFNPVDFLIMKVQKFYRISSRKYFLIHTKLLKMNFLLLQSILLWFNSYCWFPRQISKCCHLLNDDSYKKKCKHKKIYKLQIFIHKSHFRAYTTIFPFPFRLSSFFSIRILTTKEE